MVVWLKAGAVEVAFEDDIVPREAMHHLAHLEALNDRANGQASALRAAAQAEASDILSGARAEHDAITAQAHRDASAVTRLGYAQGRRDALKHWHADASARRQAAAAQYGSVRERLADMVVQATASLMRGPALAHYLEGALQALDGLAEHDQTLSVTVHPDDQALAHDAIERLRGSWRDATVVKLIESVDVAPGTCICESGQAYVDGSLSLQLSALRQAASGALDGLQLPADVTVVEPAPPAVFPSRVPAAPSAGLPPFGSPYGDYLGLGPDDDDPDDPGDTQEQDEFDRLFDNDGTPGAAGTSGSRGIPLVGGYEKPW